MVSRAYPFVCIIGSIGEVDLTMGYSMAEAVAKAVFVQVPVAVLTSVKKSPAEQSTMIEDHWLIGGFVEAGPVGRSGPARRAGGFVEAGPVSCSVPA